ncbi:hypothetical protein EV356DRAFT_230625 [Viridothelium virens]|uniref:Poly(A) RNA polymerase mitochondrial-like central palm domain-containing protein n=1 Tax=Viridothelium virens TaxID=1048519 RepID=A0A6A6H5Q6_VIRVR|nr:hypothetical protein EV356DRAFT_230625 [Viridothelium virens]
MYRTQPYYGILCKSKDAFNAPIALANIFGVSILQRCLVPDTATHGLTFTQHRKLSVDQYSIQFDGDLIPGTSWTEGSGAEGSGKTRTRIPVDCRCKGRDCWRYRRRLKQDGQNQRANALIISDKRPCNSFKTSPSRMEASISHYENSAKMLRGENPLHDSIVKDACPKGNNTQDQVHLNTMTGSPVVQEQLMYRDDNELSNEDGTWESARDIPISREAMLRYIRVENKRVTCHLTSKSSVPQILDYFRLPVVLNRERAKNVSKRGKSTENALKKVPQRREEQSRPTVHLFFDTLSQIKEFSEGLNTNSGWNGELDSAIVRDQLINSAGAASNDSQSDFVYKPIFQQQDDGYSRKETFYEGYELGSSTMEDQVINRNASSIGQESSITYSPIFEEQNDSFPKRTCWIRPDDPPSNVVSGTASLEQEEQILDQTAEKSRDDVSIPLHTDISPTREERRQATRTFSQTRQSDSGRRMQPASFKREDLRSSARMPPRINADTKSPEHDATNTDYKGIYIPLKDQSEGWNYSVPWVDGNRTKELDTRARFNAEIVAFEKWLALSEVEKRARTQLGRDVSTILLDSVSFSEVTPFGSSENGLGSVTSDLDFSWIDWKLREHPRGLSHSKIRKAQTANLQRLRKVLEKRGDFLGLSVQHAKRPLLAMQHRPTGVKLQIVMTDVPKQRWVCHYQDTCPAIRQVYFVVKATLESRGLTDVYQGGIGGYSIFAMVAAVFRLFPDLPERDPVSRLLAFLEFYSNFDTVKYGIDIVTPKIFAKTQPSPGDAQGEGQKDIGAADILDSAEDHYSIEVQKGAVNLSEQKTANSENLGEGTDIAVEDGFRSPSSLEDSSISKSHKTNVRSSHGPPNEKEVFADRATIARTDARRPYLLCLEDPACPTNDLGHKSFTIKHIIATFRHLHRIVFSSIDTSLPTSTSSVANSGVGVVPTSATRNDSLLQPFVGNAFSATVEDSKRQLKSWYYNHVIRPERIASQQHDKANFDHNAPSSSPETLYGQHEMPDAEIPIRHVRARPSQDEKAAQAMEAAHRIVNTAWVSKGSLGGDLEQTGGTL